MTNKQFNFEGEEKAAYDMINAERFDNVISLCSRQVIADISNHQAILFLGIAYLYKGELDKAAICFYYLLMQYPKNTSIWNNYAECHTRMGDVERACAIYKNALSDNPISINKFGIDCII